MLVIVVLLACSRVSATPGNVLEFEIAIAPGYTGNLPGFS